MTVRLTEEDFTTQLGENGKEVPVIEFEGSDFHLIAYGHIGREEFIEWCNEFYLYTTGESNFLDDDEDAIWAWAKPTRGSTRDEWVITWHNVSKDDEDAFPITLTSGW